MASTTPNLIDIATRHQVHLERVKSGYLSDFDQFLKRMADDITRKLSGSTKLTDYTVTRLEKLLSAIQTTLRDTYKDYGKVYFQMVKDVAEYESIFETKTLNANVITPQFTLPPPAQVRSAVLNAPLSVAGPDGGSLLEPLFSRWSERTILRIDGAIRMGYAQGQTTFQVLQRITGTRAAGFNDGLLAVARKDAVMLVRTGLQHAAAQAREEVWRNNSDIVKQVRWVSTLDARTTIQCQSMDGRTFPLDKGPRPPLHIGCRSSVVAVLDDRFKTLSDSRTRAARNEDGAYRVGATQTYYDWLKKQSPDFQDSALGPTRAKLLRDGGLSAQRFQELQLGKNFEPMTLEQMRKLEPVAFERASI